MIAAAPPGGRRLAHHHRRPSPPTTHTGARHRAAVRSERPAASYVGAASAQQQLAHLVVSSKPRGVRPRPQVATARGAKRTGSSRNGKWPAPAKTSSRLPGIAACPARPWATGIIGSRSPQTMSVGSPGRKVGDPRADALAREVHDRAGGVQEGHRAAGRRARPARRPPLPGRGSIQPSGGPALSRRRPRTQPAPRQQRRRSSAPGRAAARSREADLGAQPPLADEGEALHALGELVGQLHRHPATHRVPDHADARVPEGGHQVAQPARVGAERVVAPRLGRDPVAEQVGRHDRMDGRPARDGSGPTRRRGR